MWNTPWLIALVMATLAQRGYAELELIHPENNRSQRYLVEFRARWPSIAQQSPSGHVFVLTGRRLDNGLIYFDGAAGFYPDAENRTPTPLRHVLRSPGTVTYKMADLRSDETFLIDISAQQYETLQYVLANWEHGERGRTFDGLQNNCVSLVRNVAMVLGLDPGFAVTPIGIVKDLRAKNPRDRALRNAAVDAQRQVSARELNAARDAAITGKLNELARRQAAYDQKVRAINEMRNTFGRYAPPPQSSAGGRGTPGSSGDRATMVTPVPPISTPPPTSRKVCTRKTCPEVYPKPAAP